LTLLELAIHAGHCMTL